MAGSERTGAAAVSGPPTPDAYAAIADAFDELAASRPAAAERRAATTSSSRRSTSRSSSPGSSVLEIGSGDGDLLAALAPAERRRRRRQPRHGRSRAGAPSRASASRSARARTSSSSETFDYIVLSDLLPYVDDLLALFAERRAALAPRDADRHPLLQPALAAGAARARAAAPEAAHAAPQLGHPAGRRQPAAARRARAGHDDAADPAAAADPVRLGLLQRLPREPLGHPPALPHLLDRRAAAADRTSAGSSASRSSCRRGTRPG